MNFIYNYYNDVLLPLKNMLVYNAAINLVKIEKSIDIDLDRTEYEDGAVTEEFSIKGVPICKIVYAQQFTFHEQKNSKSKNQ